MFNLIANRCFRNVLRTLYNTRSTGTKTKVPIPINKVGDLFTAKLQPTNGYVYDKKPFKVRLEAGKHYYWCLCGKSRNQPFCDGTHRDPYLRLKHSPVRVVVEETKDYWLCNCKQTKLRPFCDGTHKSEKIQDMNIHH